MWVLPSLRVQHPEARGHLSEALTEDTGVGNSVAGSPLPLTTGNENLDVAIVIHLQYCYHLIQVRSVFVDHYRSSLMMQSSVCHGSLSVTAAVDHRGGRVAAPQPAPQTVRTDAAAGGAGRDQRGQTGSHHICC